MKKTYGWGLLAITMVSFVLSGCQSSSSSSSQSSSSQTQQGYDWEFETGTDYVEAEALEVTEWSPQFTINLKIVGAENDVLFNGQVKLKSDTMWGSEFLKAAVTDKALAQDGIDVGFVTTLGDYVNNAEESMYWLYSINGGSPSWGVNQYQMRDGDYMLWEYKAADWTSDPISPGQRTGDWQFTIGNDYVEAEALEVTEWSPEFTINLKIVGAENDVLFNGQVKLKSDTMWGSEFLKAAVTDKALAQDGIDVGFVTTLGDYVNNAEENMYWLYSINGGSPSWGINQYQLRDGDYMLWNYDVVSW